MSEISINMITPEMKDKVLKVIVEFGTRVGLDIHEAPEEFGFNSDYLELILNQFEELNLVEQEKMLGGIINLHLSANAFDLYRRGGFVAQEEIVKSTIHKLELEVKSLQKSFPEKAELYTSLLANLATIGALFLPK